VNAELADTFTCGLFRVNTSFPAMAGAAGSKDRNTTSTPVERSGFDGIMNLSMGRADDPQLWSRRRETRFRLHQTRDSMPAVG
jgi:hypothetical protein